jgi:hypothetical protein
VHPWQMVFFAVGLPGVLVALLMFTVDEPARRGTQAGHESGIPLREVFAHVKKHRRLFLAHFCGFALLAVPITTIVTWAPTYYVRILNYAMPDVALTLGLILIILSPAGVYFGGWLVDVLQKRGYTDATFRVGIGAALLLIPLSFLSTTMADDRLTTFLFCPFVFCASMSIAAAPATLQLVVPNQMRAQISATWMLVLNIVTAGAGPTAVGFISEFILGDEMKVGAAMALVNCISVPLATLALWSGLKSLRVAIAEQADKS